MKLKLKKKIVIVSGATGEIGRQICLDFLKEGAIVVPFYRSEGKRQQLMDWISKNKINLKNLYPVKVDIGHLDRINEAIKVVMEELNRIDILINCAGMVKEVPLLMLEDEDIFNQLNVNYLAPVRLTKAVLKPMFRQKSGNIINISSASARVGGRGVSIYGSSKAGLERFTEIMAQEVGKKGIRINVVSPGIIKTDMSSNLIARNIPSLMEFTSLKRYGKTTEVSKAVLFLASDATASFITGEILQVDGGIWL